AHLDEDRQVVGPELFPDSELFNMEVITEENVIDWNPKDAGQSGWPGGENATPFARIPQAERGDEFSIDGRPWRGIEITNQNERIIDLTVTAQMRYDPAQLSIARQLVSGTHRW